MVILVFASLALVLMMLAGKLNILFNKVLEGIFVHLASVLLSNFNSVIVSNYTITFAG